MRDPVDADAVARAGARDCIAVKIDYDVVGFDIDGVGATSSRKGDITVNN